MTRDLAIQISEAPEASDLRTLKTAAFVLRSAREAHDPSQDEYFALKALDAAIAKAMGEG